MTKHNDFKLTFDFFDAKPIVVEPTEALLSSDSGLVALIRLFDQQIRQNFTNRCEAIEGRLAPWLILFWPYLHAIQLQTC